MAAIASTWRQLRLLRCRRPVRQASSRAAVGLMPATVSTIRFHSLPPAFVVASKLVVVVGRPSSSGGNFACTGGGTYICPGCTMALRRYRRGSDADNRESARFPLPIAGCFAGQSTPRSAWFCPQPSVQKSNAGYARSGLAASLRPAVHRAHTCAAAAKWRLYLDTTAQFVVHPVHARRLWLCTQQ